MPSRYIVAAIVEAVRPERVGRPVEPDPAGVGEVGDDDDVVEVDRPAEAPADLVGHAHQQQAGEEQVRLLEVVQVGQPDEDVEVQEQQAEVEAAGPAVPGAQHRPAAEPRSRRSGRAAAPAAAGRRRRPGARPAGSRWRTGWRSRRRARPGIWTVWTRRALAARRWRARRVEREARVGVGRRSGCAHLAVLGRSKTADDSARRR